jgi:hypothetical protein
VSAFEQWCGRQGIQPFLATPYHVMNFIRAIVPHGETVAWRELQGISHAYASVGLSDPCLSPLTIAEFDKHFPTPCPRGWNAKEQEAFSRMPPDIKKIVVARRALDVRELRRIQNELAQVKKEEANAAS